MTKIFIISIMFTLLSAYPTPSNEGDITRAYNNNNFFISNINIGNF